jgi:hypothetical protein
VDVQALARATGGVAVSADDLAPLVAHLRALPGAAHEERVYPARSAAWVAGFVMLLCLEWAMRRRTGAA